MYVFNFGVEITRALYWHKRVVCAALPSFISDQYVSFAEIIPQSICTRHGLYIGAKMAGTVQILVFGLVMSFASEYIFRLANTCVAGHNRLAGCKAIGVLFGPPIMALFTDAQS